MTSRRLQFTSIISFLRALILLSVEAKKLQHVVYYEEVSLSELQLAEGPSGAESDPSASHDLPNRLQPRRLCPWQAELSTKLPAGTIDSPKQGDEPGPWCVSRGTLSWRTAEEPQRRPGGRDPTPLFRPGRLGLSIAHWSIGAPGSRGWASLAPSEAVQGHSDPLVLSGQAAHSSDSVLQLQYESSLKKKLSTTFTGTYHLALFLK